MAKTNIAAVTVSGSYATRNPRPTFHASSVIKSTCYDELMNL